MTDSTNNQPASKAPTHIAYHVRNREGGKGFWTRIGSAWAHKDGNGFNIQLESAPIRQLLRRRPDDSLTVSERDEK
jgi:hypothetical protein